MRLPSFAYHAPHTLDQALKIKRELGAQAPVLAGGTDLHRQPQASTLFPDSPYQSKEHQRAQRDTSETRLRDHTGGNHPDGNPEQ